MSEVALTFLGGTGTVTGSKFLLEADGKKWLIDAGLFQGLKELRLQNWSPLPFKASELSALIITHAHLDHTGYLPKLIRDGYQGRIYLTPDTAALAEIVLRDAAKLQREDAKFAQEKGYSKHSAPVPLYEIEEVELTVEAFTAIEYGERVELASGLSFTFHNSAHILGSAFAEIEVAGKRLLFTGDLGRPNHPVLGDPDSYPGGAFDAVLCESTYGDRVHPARSSALPDAINQTIKHGGSILIPAFSVDRTEIILMRLQELINTHQIPDLPVYVDSPMALAALNVYRAAIKRGASEIRSSILNSNQDPFELPNLHTAASTEASKALNNPHEPSIIISASGMATGGRVVHHLEHMLPDHRNSVLLVGYQAVGTRGQLLLQGVDELKMHGRMIPVKAKIVQIEEFSVHADSADLINWLGNATQAPSKLFVIHGEGASAESFAELVKSKLDWDAVAPSAGWRCLI
jgi:metallo-beta-lactamase family protein